MDAILAVNAGSSNIKFALFEAGDALSPLIRGKLVGLDQEAHLVARDGAGAGIADRRWPRGRSGIKAVLKDLVEWIEDHLGGDRLAAAGHRIVHGGRDFSEPVVIDEKVLRALEGLTPLAPLHQPASLAPVDALRKARPDLLQVACFDTAFHHGLEPPVSRYAIPRAYEEKGVRKYGFHGLSYEFVSRRLKEIDPGLARKRIVVAHLGSGASLCAMRDGRSVDTTMGFTALDGLVMATRCGTIDPGIVLYLMKHEDLTPDRLERLLYHESGLLGVSGISSDVRELLESSDAKAVESLDLFTFGVAREVAVMANTLRGLDGLIFTGGIGEHVGAVRAQVCERLAWLGVEIDFAANGRGAEVLSMKDSAVVVRSIATDEEMTIARHVRSVASLAA